jgi:hypothetical protein
MSVINLGGVDFQGFEIPDEIHRPRFYKSRPRWGCIVAIEITRLNRG